MAIASLTHKRILLGVTGGIAAYKSAELVRRLQDQGCDVRVVMTKAAEAFITPLTLQALSGKPVHRDLLDPEAEAGMGHIELARWADCLLIAPASADFIARLSAGRGDDLLTTLCLACDAPIAIAPAMNQAMYRDASCQANLQTLADRGIHIFGPDTGLQACGDVGPGRMLDVALLVDATAELFQVQSLSGKRVLINAGPTREALDPVRYLSNHSSGKMGYALAEAARDAGAQVTLVSGPVNLKTPDQVRSISVTSALEMHRACLEAAEDHQVFIAAAAVADYRPEQANQQKIKKTADNDALSLRLIKNPDIVAEIAALTQKPFTVGFAAETNDLLSYAKGKLERKKLDMIIANDVSNSAIGFNSDDNAVTILDKSSEITLKQANKRQLARDIIEQIAERLK